jgi:D-alanyl-lipoteichoic acid acyltransferase DltB (MBOAT superfamily)
MGLWHGANWTFVLWGIYHAMFIFLYRKFSPFFEPMPKVVTRYGGLIITLPLIMLAWVPFRASSVEKTLKMWGKVIDPSAYFSLGMREDAYVIAFIISVGFFIIYWIKQYLLPKIRSRMNYLSISIEIMGFAIMVSLIIIFLRPINQFIYFQF